MEERYYGRARQPKSKKPFRLLIFFILLVAALASGFYGLRQAYTVKTLQSDLAKFEDRLTLLEEKNQELQELNDTLLEENRMLRSSTIKTHGSRNTNLVAITIDDGYGKELIEQALDHLKEHNVLATFFPVGEAVKNSPEVWRRAVEEGHELGNHTYRHTFLTTISENQARDELNRWQETVDEALGYPYKTLFFRPPGMDGYTSGQISSARRYHEIIAEAGMFAVLWDIELFNALSSRPYTPANIADHVLTNARGGSIVLLHFKPSDIAALPEILSGLRRRGLEPCSLSELLLAEPRT